ncbi:8890_t:CDS:2, partial [Scutellospora calospora]
TKQISSLVALNGLHSEHCIFVKISISTSTSDYIDDDDIYSVDIFDELPRPDES